MVVGVRVEECRLENVLSFGSEWQAGHKQTCTNMYVSHRTMWVL